MQQKRGPQRASTPQTSKPTKKQREESKQHEQVERKQLDETESTLGSPIQSTDGLWETQRRGSP